MRSFRDYPIKQKLTGIIMLTSLATLVLACFSISAYQQYTFRDKLARDQWTLADVLDDSLTTGLTFTDTDSLDHILKTLNAHRYVMAAAVYDKTGKRVSAFVRDPQAGEYPWPPLQKEGSYFQSDRLGTFKDIPLAGEVIGTLYIGTDFGELHALQSRNLLISGLVLLVSSLAAYGLANWLQRFISVPISALSETAGRVAAETNYNLRAVKHGDDEVGGLIDRFNQMLAQIQAQELALREVNSQLEQRVTERTAELTQAHDKLAASHQELRLLEAAMRASVNAIAITDAQGCIRWVNPAFSVLTGYSAEEADGLNPRVLKSGFQDDPFYQQLWDTILAGQPWHGELVNRRKDGSLYDEEMTITPVKDLNGGPLHFIAVKQDITARIKAEADLLEIRQELLVTSRQAGMAEVATSVLHNVGNVLNSVSVSAEVVTGKVRQNKAGNLLRVAQLLREHEHDLTGFLTQDPRGKELPGYLLKLAGHLAGPPEDLLQELAALRKNIEHIKEIVAMQQNYARCSGVIEPLPLVELVEDAIRINLAGLGRHEVHLIREFSPVPPVMTDRHKVMQILVNLLNNAKYAVSGTTRDKQLIVRVSPNGNEGVKVEVVDNGIGIAPENLNRIFQHGFTTKKEGHGFGLHSGANTAKELGGRLSVQSDGLDRGATFALELPLQHRRK